MEKIKNASRWELIVVDHNRTDDLFYANIIRQYPI